MRCLAAALALLVALAPTAAAAPGEEPCARSFDAGSAPLARAEAHHVTCDGESWAVALTAPVGRTELRWYDDERGVGLELHAPPRSVAWWSDGSGCHLVLYLFGATDVGCLAGEPPSPREVA